MISSDFTMVQQDCQPMRQGMACLPNTQHWGQAWLSYPRPGFKHSCRTPSVRVKQNSHTQGSQVWCSNPKHQGLMFEFGALRSTVAARPKSLRSCSLACPKLLGLVSKPKAPGLAFQTRGSWFGRPEFKRGPKLLDLALQPNLLKLRPYNFNIITNIIICIINVIVFIIINIKNIIIKNFKNISLTLKNKIDLI